MVGWSILSFFFLLTHPSFDLLVGTSLRVILLPQLDDELELQLWGGEELVGATLVRI